jgi:hypothetical protein
MGQEAASGERSRKPLTGRGTVRVGLVEGALQSHPLLLDDKDPPSAESPLAGEGRVACRLSESWGLLGQRDLRAVSGRPPHLIVHDLQLGDDTVAVLQAVSVADPLPPSSGRRCVP